MVLQVSGKGDVGVDLVVRVGTRRARGERAQRFGRSGGGVQGDCYARRRVLEPHKHAAFHARHLHADAVRRKVALPCAIDGRLIPGTMGGAQRYPCLWAYQAAPTRAAA